MQKSGRIESSQSCSSSAGPGHGSHSRLFSTWTMARGPVDSGGECFYS